MDIMTMWHEQQLCLATRPQAQAVPVARIIGLGATILCSVALAYNAMVGGYFSAVQLPEAETGFAQGTPLQLKYPRPQEEVPEVAPMTAPMTLVKAPLAPQPRKRYGKTCHRTVTRLYGSGVTICDVPRSPIRPGPERNLASLTR